MNKMNSKIRFEVNKSTTTVNFLDVSVTLKDGLLKTNLYTKPTDAFMYLNKSSNHPKHVIDNIPKGQFIRTRRMCTEKEHYLLNCNQMCTYFLKRGYDRKKLHNVVKEICKN